MGNPHKTPIHDHEADGSSDQKSPPLPEEDWRSSYREVMRVGEFRALWLAHALAMVGNSLLSIAVTVLVYQQTQSAFAAGVTLAVTFLPPIISGPLFSGLADVFPHRRVMVSCDVLRACLVLCIGIPGMPLWAIWVLVFCSILPAVPFAAARAALLAEIVQGDRYVAGSAIIQLTSQLGSLIGLTAGGAIVAVIGPNPAVMFNALTFLLAAGIIVLGVRARPAARAAEAEHPGLWRMVRGGAVLVFGDSRLRTLALFAWLAGLYIVPFGLANPLAAEAGAGPAAAGLIMAGPSMGAIIGGFVLTRLINPRARMWLLGPLAVLASVPLLVWFLHPPLWLMVSMLALSGAAASYQFVANAAFVLCVPPEGRALAFGLVAGGLQAVQGIGILLASFLAEILGPNVVIGTAGIFGVLGAFVLAVPWTRMSEEAVSRMNSS